ncbi:hypothetical protein [Natrinema salsiterrestre]|uniref:DUF8001 domain-containing protein n=1 Tax=Natrinema salsiterrestre TaxID=2950540 RepID=A0A9Q4LAG3_9EURY|nr:hypothetical protein [Natrinema salsiterrestre]MDF9748346.1 hypothetical protein [Natrinema salsiterrestre]
MSNPLRVSAGELEIDDIMSAIEEGRRVVITTTAARTEYDVTLRYDGSVYYCDTPTRLHRHESEGEMRSCIRKMGYGAVAEDT